MAQTNVLVSGLITAAFDEAARKLPQLHQCWVQISHAVGGSIPGSLLSVSIQRDGSLDMVLRCMEDEQAGRGQATEGPGLFTFNYQRMLSELWVGSMYETLRTLKERKLMPDTGEFRSLEHDLRLLRIPLEKHEIASQGQLQRPLQMRRYPPNDDETDNYTYVKQDPQRSHIMPTAISPRGSLMWQALDVAALEERWLERRSLSERIVAMWSSKEKQTQKMK
jgi:hypothetical protein